jgi:hypothetical protein
MDSASKLREICNNIRTKPTPLSDIIPTLQKVADEIDRLVECEDVLRHTSSYIGVGGYNTITVDPKIYKDKIIDGINNLIKTTSQIGR